MNIQFGLKVKHIANGCVGNIINICWEKKRAQVEWRRERHRKTWVHFAAIVEEKSTPAEELQGLIMQKVLTEVNNYFIVFLKISFSKDQTFDLFFAELKQQQQTNPKMIENMIGREAAELLKTI